MQMAARICLLPTLSSCPVQVLRMCEEVVAEVRRAPAGPAGASSASARADIWIAELPECDRRGDVLVDGGAVSRMRRQTPTDRAGRLGASLRANAQRPAGHYCKGSEHCDAGVRNAPATTSPAHGNLASTSRPQARPTRAKPQSAGATTLCNLGGVPRLPLLYVNPPVLTRLRWPFVKDSYRRSTTTR